MIIEEKSPQVKEKVEKIAKKTHILLLRKGSCVYLNTSSLSWSMYPFIKGGDTIKVAPVKEKNIKVGDVIAVDNQDKAQVWFYVHRVVEILKDNNMNFYVTKGDAAKEGRDKPVGFDRIVGKVTEIKRGGLRINLEHPLWDKYLNKYIARASASHGGKLRAISPYISLIIEWRWFFSKLKRRIRGIS